MPKQIDILIICIIFFWKTHLCSFHYNIQFDQTRFLLILNKSKNITEPNIFIWCEQNRWFIISLSFLTDIKFYNCLTNAFLAPQEKIFYCPYKICLFSKNLQVNNLSHKRNTLRIRIQTYPNLHFMKGLAISLIRYTMNHSEYFSHKLMSKNRPFLIVNHFQEGWTSNFRVKNKQNSSSLIYLSCVRWNELRHCFFMTSSWEEMFWIFLYQLWSTCW